DVVTPRAERFAYTNFACALSDAHEHDVHDDDTADDERDRGDADHDDEEAGANIFPKGKERVTRLDSEIVFSVIADVVAPTHDLANFVDAFLNMGGGAGARRNPQGIVLRAEFLAIGGKWKNDPVVERRAEGWAFFFADADYLARNVVPANFFSDRIDARH